MTSATLEDDAAHVLVVDDDRRLRALLSSYLMKNGHRVTVAATAAEARAFLDGLAFDIIVLDVMMPGESGFEFAADLRKRSQVPILMLTARGEPQDRVLRTRDRRRRLSVETVRTARASVADRLRPPPHAGLALRQA